MPELTYHLAIGKAVVNIMIRKMLNGKMPKGRCQKEDGYMDAHIDHECDLAELLAQLTQIISQLDNAGLAKIAVYVDMAKELLSNEIERQYP